MGDTFSSLLEQQTQQEYPDIIFEDQQHHPTSTATQSSVGLLTPEHGSDDEMVAPSETPERNTHDAKSKLSHLLKDKEEEWNAVVQKKENTGPLRLLDLPLDVLQEIIKEVSTLNCVTHDF